MVTLRPIRCVFYSGRGTPTTPGRADQLPEGNLDSPAWGDWVAKNPASSFQWNYTTGYGGPGVVASTLIKRWGKQFGSQYFYDLRWTFTHNYHDSPISDADCLQYGDIFGLSPYMTAAAYDARHNEYFRGYPESGTDPDTGLPWNGNKPKYGCLRWSPVWARHLPRLGTLAFLRAYGDPPPPVWVHLDKHSFAGYASGTRDISVVYGIQWDDMHVAMVESALALKAAGVPGVIVHMDELKTQTALHLVREVDGLHWQGPYLNSYGEYPWTKYIDGTYPYTEDYFAGHLRLQELSDGMGSKPFIIDICCAPESGNTWAADANGDPPQDAFDMLYAELEWFRTYIDVGDGVGHRFARCCWNTQNREDGSYSEYEFKWVPEMGKGW